MRSGTVVRAGAFGARHGSTLTPQERDSLKVAFEKIDGLGGVDEEVQRLIDEADEDGNGQIDKEEFTHIMTRKFLGEEDDGTLIHASELLDVNKDGFIPLSEFRKVLMTEGDNPLSEAEADEMMMFADPNG